MHYFFPVSLKDSMLKDFERLSYAVKWLCYTNRMTQKELAGLLGYTNATVLSQILTGKKPVPKNLAERVAVLHPKINIEFLRGTSEDLLVEGERPPITPAEPSPRNSKTKAAPDSEAQKDEAGNENGIFIPHELAALFTDMSATIKSQQESINKLIEKLK